MMRKSQSIAGASLILASATLLSGLLGLVRNRLLATNFGAGSQLDIYFAALRIPDFLTTVLITGSIAVAVIPVFNQYRSHSEKEGWQFISALVRWLFLFLTLLSFLLMVLAPWLAKAVAPGFSGDQIKQMVLMMRIMLLSPLLLSLSMIISSVLQSLRHFLISSLAPIFYNLGIVLGILFLVPRWGLTGLAWGVVLGSFLHLAIQLPALRTCRFRYYQFFPHQRQALREVLKLGGARTLGVTANQLNILVITSLASILSMGSISVYNFAADISQSLTRLIGVSFTTAVFPTLALNVSQHQKKEFLENFTASFRQIFYLVAPISLLLFILRAQIVRIFLGAGRFDWVDTRMTAACLGILSLSVFAQALVTLISRSFAAWHDTKTPARINIAVVVLNILFSLLFINLLGRPGVFSNFWRSFLKLQNLTDIRVVGLALAFSLMTIVQLIWLLLEMHRKTDSWSQYFPKKEGRRILIALASLVGLTYGSLYLTALWLNTTSFWGILLQTILAGGAGIGIYLLISWRWHFPELKAIYQGAKAELTK